MAKVIILEKENFQQVVLENEKPVLVDFWSDWCPPCKTIAPFLEELAEKQEKVVIAKLDVQKNQELAVQYQITSIPSFLLFEKGVVQKKIVGADKQALQNLMDSIT